MYVHRLADMTSPSTSAPSWSRATWALLMVLCGALFLDALDISMIGVALPSIGSDLHMSAGSLQWIVSAYVLGYGGLLLLGGRPACPIWAPAGLLRAGARLGAASLRSGL